MVRAGLWDDTCVTDGSVGHLYFRFESRTCPGVDALWLAIHMREFITSEKLPAVAVLGLGTMGHGIAQTFAAAGYTVRCFDEHLETRHSLHARIQKNLDAFVQEGLLPQARIEPILSRVIACESEADAVSSVAFVTEAVKEDLAVKQELFARLETVA